MLKSLKGSGFINIPIRYNVFKTNSHNIYTLNPDKKTTNSRFWFLKKCTNLHMGRYLDAD